MSGSARRAGRTGWSTRIEGWFFDPVAVHAMVLNRCILGSVLCLNAVFRIPEFGLLYGSASGAWSPPFRELVSRFLAGDPVGHLPLAVVSVLAQLGSEPRQVVLVTLYVLLLAASLAFALGLFTRTAGCLAVAIQLVLVAIHPYANWGWSRMVVPFTLYVVLSRAGDHASVDAWRRRRRGEAPPSDREAAWPMRLLQIHVVAMYLTSAARLDDPRWLHGQALFMALGQQLYARFDLDLPLLAPMLPLLSYAVLVLEPAAVVLLWIPRVRTLCALALLAMHVILEILNNVGWWNYLMIGGLLTFLPPAWVARLLPARPA